MTRSSRAERPPASDALGGVAGVVVFSAIAFAVPMAGVLLDPDNGVRAGWNLYLELTEVRAALSELEAERDARLAEIDALEHDPFEIERRAREELRMIRPGERILRCCD